MMNADFPFRGLGLIPSIHGSIIIFGSDTQKKAMNSTWALLGVTGQKPQKKNEKATTLLI